MKILKYIVIILFLFSALFVSRKYASFIDLRIEYTRAFLKFLEHIEGKISSYLSPPNELGDGFEREELSRMIEGLKNGESLLSAYSGERGNVPLEADELLFSYFSDFGKGNLELELSRLKKTISALRGILAEVEAEGEKRKKLCTGVTPALALGIIIWLI
jgi:hypothetical protein